MEKRPLRICLFVLHMSVLSMGIFMAHIPTPARAGEAGEYQVKAAFLYHFATFISWPSSTFTKNKGTFRVCLMGKDPFGATLETVLGKKTIKTHRVAIDRNPSLKNLSDCHLAYFTEQEGEKIQRVRHHIATKDVLTVGDSSEFINMGGMIQLYIQDQKVRFAINPDAIHQTNLKVSSKLLRLAKIISP